MEPLKLIKINDQNELVRSWQFFLIGQGFYQGVADGVFGSVTKGATIEFQKKFNLQPDGIVGNKSFGIAMQLGFDGIVDNRMDTSSPAWPPKPSFQPLTSNQQRQQIFGEFTFVHEPLSDNPENIRITNNWESQNIVTISIPQLTAVKGSDRVRFHKLAANQLQKLWQDWENAGLLPLVLTWAGSFVPRFIRGSTTVLSNHSFGSAFDINVAWNQLGVVPALVGQKGCVRELVPIANENGFYWGGHFSKNDGMHFEVAKII